jgi:hypothetical protein
LLREKVAKFQCHSGLGLPIKTPMAVLLGARLVLKNTSMPLSD